MGETVKCSFLVRINTKKKEQGEKLDHKEKNQEVMLDNKSEQVSHAILPVSRYIVLLIHSNPAGSNLKHQTSNPSSNKQRLIFFKILQNDTGSSSHGM